MNKLIGTENTGVITSLELVEQVNLFRKEIEGKSELKHYDLLKVIRDEFEEEIDAGKISAISYTDAMNREKPMFELTHAQAKQVLVRESKVVRKAVIAYIEKLENELRKNQPIIDPIVLLAQGVVDLRSAMGVLETRFDNHLDNQTLTTAECDRFTNAVKKKGVDLLGGKNSPAYKSPSTRSKTYSNVHGGVKDHFVISTYKTLKSNELDEALEIVETHRLPKPLTQEISEKNGQLSLFGETA